MAIRLDRTSSGSSQTTTTTVSHTVGFKGINQVLIVGVSITDSVGISATVPTYAGVNMTQINTEANSVSAGDDVWVSLWYLASPARGTNNIVVTAGATPSSVVVLGTSFTGVDQVTPIEASNKATGASNAPSVDVTTVSDNAWAIDMVGQKGTGADPSTLTVGAGQIRQVYLEYNDGLSAANTGGMSTEEKASAGSVTMSWSSDQSTSWGSVAGAMKPAPPTLNFISNNLRPAIFKSGNAR